ncbi:MAG: zinc dependent phospholipase C family protein [Eubacteriaceae bacterium]
MSDMLNHYYCGREILDRLPDDNTIKQAALNHYDAYRFGTQGPDFLYYSLTSAVLNRRCQKLAKLIHTQKTTDFFYEGLKYSQDSLTDVGLAYMAGFTTHYCLDVETHPFIFCRTGKFRASAPHTRIYGYLHKLYEVMLDTAMTQYEYNTQAVNRTPEKVFRVSPETSDYLEYFYNSVSKSVYDFDTRPGVITRARHEALEIVRKSKDPSGAKRKLLTPVENLAGEPLFATRLLYPEYTDELSVLNLNHEAWYQPVTGEEHHESYPQLFHSAVEKGAFILSSLDKYFPKNSFTYDDILALYKNKSYLSGIDCNVKETFKYFDIFFESPLTVHKICG